MRLKRKTRRGSGEKWGGMSGKSVWGQPPFSCCASALCFATHSADSVGGGQNDVGCLVPVRASRWEEQVETTFKAGTWEKFQVPFDEMQRGPMHTRGHRGEERSDTWKVFSFLLLLAPRNAASLLLQMRCAREVVLLLWKRDGAQHAMWKRKKGKWVRTQSWEREKWRGESATICKVGF